MLGSLYLTSNIIQTAPAQNVVSLTELSNIERTDLKPYCLLLEAQQKRYFLSLKNDEELYNWQDDIYSRSPLSGVSNPTNFVHKVHVGFDPVSGAFTVSTVSYNEERTASAVCPTLAPPFGGIALSCVRDNPISPPLMRSALRR